jgi:hypothetical protein
VARDARSDHTGSSLRWSSADGGVVLQPRQPDALPSPETLGIGHFGGRPHVRCAKRDATGDSTTSRQRGSRPYLHLHLRPVVGSEAKCS